MRLLTSALVLFSYLSRFSTAQDVTVPSTCTDGFTAGTDEVLLTIPYSYSQVMSVIGSYKNLTWSGNPDNTVTLNGTNNKVGTARIYDTTAGSHIIETLLTYIKPPSGPYVEVHNTAEFSVSAYNLSIYIPFDGTVVTSVCSGRASTFNFTARYCSNNATIAGVVLHQVHLTDGLTVGTYLGGEKFTTCEAIGSGIVGNGGGNGTNSTMSGNCTSSANSTSNANCTSSANKTSGTATSTVTGGGPASTTTYRGVAAGSVENSLLSLMFMSVLAAVFVLV